MVWTQGAEVVRMWWIYVVVVAVLAFGVYAFLTLVGVRTRWLTRRTERTVESMYPNYAGPVRPARRLGRRRRDEREGPGERDDPFGYLR
jgi:hypothetical protein